MRKKAWEEEKKSLSLTDIQSQLPAMKKDAATSWLKEVDAKALDIFTPLYGYRLPELF